MKKVFGITLLLTVCMVSFLALSAFSEAGKTQTAFKPTFEIRLVAKDTPTGEGVLPEGTSVFTAQDLIDAVANYPASGKASVSIILNKKAGERLSDITAANAGNDLFIIGNGRVLAMYKIEKHTKNGILLVDNNFSDEEARDLMDAIWLSAFGTTSEN
ncbi:MAG: hypothetical protein ABID83_01805 [Candidatus Omnitrophota bacterium]